MNLLEQSGRLKQMQNWTISMDNNCICLDTTHLHFINQQICIIINFYSLFAEHSEVIFANFKDFHKFS